MGTESVRVVIEVTAGVVPGTPEPEFTRTYHLTSTEWEEAGADQGEALAELNGRALGYAALLMLQRDTFNWVRTDWLWP